MIDEQVRTVNTFRNNFNSKEKIVIYGTGINAEAVIKSCRDYQIEGVMDVAKTGLTFCGLQVLSEEEILEIRAKYIVIIARPAVLTIIYKRIQNWAEKHGIIVFDIYRNNLADKTESLEKESPYFEVTYDQLMEQIELHDVVSFDIFDTLLTRKVYEPTDVFSLLGLKYNETLPFDFYVERQNAERDLQLVSETNINEIYYYLGKKWNLPKEVCQKLLDSEIEKEREVLIKRERMVRCFHECLDKGKLVYLVSDMYFPQNILKEFLKSFDIDGYKELLVSCDYNVSKKNGLFCILREKVDGKRCIHIGDNYEADYKAAKRDGIDAYRILSPVRMLEISTYNEVLSHLENIETRIMIGMLCAEVFNDPFSLYNSKGKPQINGCEKFGRVFIAPIAVSFMLWLLNEVNNKPNALLIFPARDGWIMQKIYHVFQKEWNDLVLPEDIYLLISRNAVSFVFNEKGAQQEENTYLNYVRNLKINDYSMCYFFDFMSRGTCQLALEKMLSRRIEGLYFQRSLSGNAEKDSLTIRAFFKEKNAYEKDLRIFAMCDFLECIFTSDFPSFLEFDNWGQPVFAQEKRSDNQRTQVGVIHESILAYCREFAIILGEGSKGIPSTDFCNEILKYTESKYSVNEIPELKSFNLDDWDGDVKNAGEDIFA